MPLDTEHLPNSHGQQVGRRSPVSQEDRGDPRDPRRTFVVGSNQSALDCSLGILAVCDSAQKALKEHVCLEPGNDYPCLPFGRRAVKHEQFEPALAGPIS